MGAYQNGLENLLQHRLLGTIPIGSDPIGPGVGLCISAKFPHDTDGVSIRTGFEEATDSERAPPFSAEVLT